jgi:hypothetical protein
MAGEIIAYVIKEFWKLPQNPYVGINDEMRSRAGRQIIVTRNYDVGGCLTYYQAVDEFHGWYWSPSWLRFNEYFNEVPITKEDV